MAINKNFVIKNGVEVNTSLIVGDADLNKVGVGTTVPGYTLHVGGSRGGIGATDLTVTGIATVGTSGSTSAALSVVGVSSFQGDVNFLGSAGVSTITFDASLDKLNFADNARATFGASDDLQIFHDGSNSIIRETGTGNIVLEGSGETLAVFADDGAVSLYYDNTNVFQTTPQGVNVSGVTTSARLNVSGISTLDGGVVIGSATSIFANGNVAFAGLATANGGVQVGTAASIYTNGNIAAAGIVTANGGLAVGAAVTLASNGNAGFTGIVTAKGVIDANGGINASSAKIEDLTDNRVVIAGTSGELEDSANLTFDGTTLAVTGKETVSVDITVGSGVTIQNHGGLSVAGISTFGGLVNVDGGITANTAIVEDLTNNRVVIAGTGGELEDSANLTFDGSTLAVTGDETVSGKVSVGSGVTAFANGNLAVAGISTFNGNVLVGTGITIQPHGGVSIAGIVTVGGDLNVVGDITYDEIGGRNINITGFSTFGNDLNVGLTTFFVDVSNGGVGVGTDNPNPQTFGPQFKVFGHNPVITLEDDGSGANAFGFIRQNSNTLQIVTGDNTDNKIQISKTSDTSSSWTGANLTNIVTIDQGNIGVGIATATLRDSSKLDVDGDARFSGKVAVRDGGNAGAGVTIFDNGNIIASGIVTAGTALVAASAKVEDLTDNRVVLAGTGGELEDSANLTFDGAGLVVTGNANVSGVSTLSNDLIVGVSTLFVDVSAGRIGVGTAAPAHNLEIKGSFPDFAISDSDTTNDKFRILHNSGQTQLQVDPNGVSASSHLLVAIDGSERFRITSASLVGIATDNPDAFNPNADDLVIFGTGHQGLTIRSGSGHDGSIMFNDTNDANQRGIIRYDHTTDALRFHNSSGELVALDGANVGIGTTRPTAKLHIEGNSDDGDSACQLRIEDTDDTAGSGIPSIQFFAGGENSGRIRGSNSTGLSFATGNGNTDRFFLTPDGNASIAGIVTFSGTGAIHVPDGTTAQRPAGVDGYFRYNTDDNQFEGFANGSWGAIAGGGGGVSETDTSVSTTTATGVGSFAVATHRSASIIAQIDQGGSYQVGRYLMIHDGTTATVIEESAIATGDMLGSFTADVNNSNAELKVTMNSSGIATVTTKIDTVTV